MTIHHAKVRIDVIVSFLGNLEKNIVQPSLRTNVLKNLNHGHGSKPPPKL